MGDGVNKVLRFFADFAAKKRFHFNIRRGMGMARSPVRPQQVYRALKVDGEINYTH